MIYCLDVMIKEIYIGHTTNLIQRKNRHKTNCNNNKPTNRKYNYYLYQFIRANGGWDNWSFIVLETASLNNIDDAIRLEHKWFIEKQATLNKQIPQVIENKKEYQKEYLLKNADKFKERQREYYSKNKDKYKEYYEQNKDKINELKKEWRLTNNDKIKVYRRNKYQINKQINKLIKFYIYYHSTCKDCIAYPSK
jgi:hypothetical protein